MTKSAKGLRICVLRLSSSGMTYLHQWQESNVHSLSLGGR